MTPGTWHFQTINNEDQYGRMCALLHPSSCLPLRENGICLGLVSNTLSHHSWRSLIFRAPPLSTACFIAPETHQHQYSAVSVSLSDLSCSVLFIALWLWRTAHSIFIRISRFPQTSGSLCFSDHPFCLQTQRGWSHHQHHVLNLAMPRVAWSFGVLFIPSERLQACSRTGPDQENIWTGTICSKGCLGAEERKGNGIDSLTTIV